MEALFSGWGIMLLLVYFVGLIVVVYVVVRVASIAHFRSKLDYLRAVMSDNHKGANDGEG